MLSRVHPEPHKPWRGVIPPDPAARLEDGYQVVYWSPALRPTGGLDLGACVATWTRLRAPQKP